MARRGWDGPVPLSDLTGGIVDPVLRKRAGLSLALVQSWEEIVGPGLAVKSRPDKVAWPRRIREDDPFEPATLVVACEGMAALQIQHMTGEIVGRVNAFLGFAAIGHVRIVQKPVASMEKPAPRRLPEIGEGDRRAVARSVEGIEDEALKASLKRLGETVKAAKMRQR